MGKSARLKPGGGDAGSPAQANAPAEPGELRTPPDDRHAPKADVKMSLVHEAFKGAEDTLAANPLASTGFLSLVGHDAIALPDAVATVLVDGQYRAEDGEWVMRVVSGRIVAAAHRSVSHAFNENDVTLVPSTDEEPGGTDDDTKAKGENDGKADADAKEKADAAAKAKADAEAKADADVKAAEDAKAKDEQQALDDEEVRKQLADRGHPGGLTRMGHG